MSDEQELASAVDQVSDDYLKELLADVDRAMELEGVDQHARDRVLNRLMYGHPYGQQRRQAMDAFRKMTEYRTGGRP